MILSTAVHGDLRRASCLTLALALTALPLTTALAEESPDAGTARPKDASTADRAADEDYRPWRLREELLLPDWLWFEGEHRTRFEYVGNQFRAGSSGDNHAVSMRTLLRLELRYDMLALGGEFEDSRVYYEDREAPINTTVVNSLELLQAYLKLDIGRYLGDDVTSWVRAGRLTTDFGSRRLVARNRYRNTINAFTGVEGLFEVDEIKIKALAATPVQRRPTRFRQLRENEHQLDREHEDVHFWGYHVSGEILEGQFIEHYIFGLNESDSHDRPTRNREIYSWGLRYLKKKAVNDWDMDIEGVYQFGNSRATSSRFDRTNLQHRAFFVHAAAGYTFDCPWTPRVVLQYDYASGDRDPTDKDNERFDTLFGARRFEFGPTGIYGLIARSNLNSPGLRVEVKPDKSLSAFFGYRAFWLADKTDAWVAAGIQDPTGNSGRFVGHQLEARVRWKILPGNLMWEIGGVTLIRGRFARTAPGANAGEPIQGYSQLVLKF